MLKTMTNCIMQREPKTSPARSIPKPERDCRPALAQPQASLRSRQAPAAAPAARHDARYWEAVDRLDFFDPAG